MLKIAICDDTPDELQSIFKLTNEYLTAHNITAQVRQFSHPDKLLLSCEKEIYHIFLLDMVMPMVNGLELGRKIRQQSTDAQIIYITTEPNFALDAYAVNPLHYLLKPINKPAFYAALDLGIEKACVCAEQCITIKTREGLRTIPTDTIVFAEYAKHKVRYTLNGGKTVETISIIESFSEHIKPLLVDKRFIAPHAAFAVNMIYAERLDKKGFTLRGGAFVPVSGKQFMAVRTAYMNYRLGEI